MKLRHITLKLFLLSQVLISAQNLPSAKTNGSIVRSQKTANALGLFHIGVASGDPTDQSVVIWTHLLGDSVNDVSGIYLVALDTGFTQVVHSGSFTTGAQMNYSVKVNVSNLNPDTHYYYYFSALNENSLTGRTKTAPSTTPSEGSLKFAVLSCQNYEHGYFNILGEFAKLNDLDAVVHLGDYIYEYGKDSNSIGREHGPNEVITLEDYRNRYELYKTDPDLIRIHQQYPFIQVWDDHEVANNAWKDGADNHNPNTEGPWNVRKSAGYRAFYEYQPMWPGQDSSVYRSISYGPLAEIMLLDTRFVGREKQIYDVTDSLVYVTNRTLLGGQQLNWFKNKLNTSTAQWKLVANQVYFSPFHIGWAAVPPYTANQLENVGLDSWDGYPMERKKILNHIASNQIDDVVILTGDIHAAFANEVADPVNDTGNGYAPVANYDPITGMGAGAVEFVTPSISSDNFDELFNPFIAAFIESKFNTPLPNGNAPNPHTKFLDMDRHGGFILSVDSSKAQADYYFVDTRLAPSDSMYFETGLNVSKGTHLLNLTGTNYPAKGSQAIPAPLKPRTYLIGLDENAIPEINLNLYPNPAKDVLNIKCKEFAGKQLDIKVYDLSGKTIRFIRLKKFNGSLKLKLADYPPGNYFISFERKDETHIRKIQIVR